MADNRPKIGLDLDGCLANFSGRFIQLMNAKYGMKAKPEEQSSWDFTCFGITPEQESEVWKDIEATNNFWGSLQPMPDTHVLTYAKDKYRLYFITARTVSCGLSVEDQTANWLRRHFFIPNPTVIGAKRKADLARELELDAFLDDKFETARAVATRGILTYLHDQPYNRHVNDLPRVSSVNEFFLKLHHSGGIDGAKRQQVA